MSTLKRALFDKYGGFADRRIKKLEKGNLFIVDTRKAGGEASNGLYGWFCAITVTVMSEAEIQVELSGSIPTSEAIQNWFETHQLVIRNILKPCLQIRIRNGEQTKLGELASLVQAIVALGAPRYSEPSYKFNCPRTAFSLQKLQAVLQSVWGTQSAASARDESLA